MNTLVIGGTSGLGLEIARDFRSEGDKVWVTGRRAFKESGLTYIRLDLAGPELPKRIREFVVSLPKINSLIYAAGFFQDGRVTDLSTRQIEDMLDVCGRGLIYLMKEILDKQGNLDELVTITSTSQWTPRQREPIYNFVKSGVAHFSNAMAEDGRVGRVLVAGPSGMRTSFCKDIATTLKD